MLANVHNNEHTTSEGLLKEAKRLKERYQTVEEEQEDNWEEVWDDVSGAPLSPRGVKKAMRAEIEYVHKMRLYDTVPTSEAYQQTCKGPISVRWIDINKGDSECPIL